MFSSYLGKVFPPVLVRIDTIPLILLRAISQSEITQLLLKTAFKIGLWNNLMVARVDARAELGGSISETE